MSDNLSRPSWKQCALLLILLSHAVFGSPIVPAVNTAYESLEAVSQADISSPKSLPGSLEEDIFGPTLDERSDRKKRLFYDTFKKAKQAKLLTLGAASSGVAKDAAKKIGKSVLKTVATLGIKAIIFNFLYSTIIKLGLLKKVINPLNVALFRQATASAAAHLPPTERTEYHFDPETPDFTSTDDSSSTLHISSPSLNSSLSISSQSDSSSIEPYDRSDQNSDSETTTIQEESASSTIQKETASPTIQEESASSTIQEGSASSKYDDSFGGHGDRYSPQRENNYFELRGFENRVSKARQDYPYPLHEDTQFIPAESSPQEFYYTYEQARSLPPPFGYNIEY